MTVAEEKLLIENFKETYLDFPSGTLEKKQPPFTDYLLTTNDARAIGIELTEIFIDNRLKQKSSEKQRLTDEVLAKLETIMPFTFCINIDLNDSNPLPKAKRKEVCENLLTICVDEFSDLQNYESKELINIETDLAGLNPQVRNHLLLEGYRNLPVGIGRINIHRFDSVSKSWNRQSEGGFVPRFTNEFLKKALEKKEKKLLSYVRCDEFWLVIKEGNYFSGTFDEIDLEMPVNTSFDKVFIYRSKNKEIVQLR